MSKDVLKAEVTATPHIRAKIKTQHLMLLVIIALIPSGFYGVYHFGYKALLHILLTVGFSVALEFLYRHYTHKSFSVNDGSAVITGLLLAYCIPVSAPLWVGPLGAAFAIIVVKQLFGGLGQNFVNPALAARVFLLLSFPTIMTDYTYDGITSATPLEQLKNTNTLPEGGIWSMVTGNIGGTIGETCTIAILIGALILLMFEVIDIKIPAIIIITAGGFLLLFNYLFGSHEIDFTFLSAHLAGGGLMLGAWFMATDYVTRPVTQSGQAIYAFIIGLLVAIFRWFGNSAESISFAILFGNLLAPLLEKLTVRKAFGIGGNRV